MYALRKADKPVESEIAFGPVDNDGFNVYHAAYWVYRQVDICLCDVSFVDVCIYSQ